MVILNFLKSREYVVLLFAITLRTARTQVGSTYQRPSMRPVDLFENYLYYIDIINTA